MRISQLPNEGEAPRPRDGSGTKVKILLVVLGIIGAAAFSEALSYFNPGNSLPGPYTVTIQITNGASGSSSLGFSPATVTLVLGVNNTVQWVDLDQTSNAIHTVIFTQVPTNATASSISSSISPGIRYGVYYGPILLSVPGVYLYHCYYHSWMTGKIVVKA